MILENLMNLFGDGVVRNLEERYPKVYINIGSESKTPLDYSSLEKYAKKIVALIESSDNGRRKKLFRKLEGTIYATVLEISYHSPIAGCEKPIVYRVSNPSLQNNQHSPSSQ